MAESSAMSNDRLSTESCPTKASLVFGDVVFNNDDHSLCYSSASASYDRKPSSGSAGSEASSSAGASTAGPLFQSEDAETLPMDTTVGTFETNDKENSNMEPIAECRKAAPSKPSSNKSSSRRDLILKTRNAVLNATQSVNSSLNAGKDNKFASKTNDAKKVRFQSKEDENEARKVLQMNEEGRRQILRLKRDISSNHFKEKGKRDQEQRLRAIAEAEKNYLFNSEVYRDHKETLKKQRDDKRRESTAAREKVRANHRKGEMIMREMRSQEEEAIFDCRHDSNRAVQKTKEELAKKRRESFAFRGGDARRIKSLRDEWSREESEKNQASYELDRNAAKDADNYRKEMTKERRESLAGRGDEFRKVRDRVERSEAEAAAKLAAEYELTRAANRDVDAYRKKQAEIRRLSIAGRNAESARHAKVMKELESVALEKESEYYVLKFAAAADADAYKKSLEKERRESLQARGKEFQRQKTHDESMHSKEIQEQIDEGKLQSGCHLDVEEYKKKCAERDRKSLEFRGTEFVARKVQESIQIENQRVIDEKNNQLETLARSDVREYVKFCKNRRRMSLALRAKEKRKHQKWEEQRKEQEIRERSAKSHADSLDLQYMERAKQRERARLAISALRDAGCTIAGNPFAGILE